MANIRERSMVFPFWGKIFVSLVLVVLLGVAIGVYFSQANIPNPMWGIFNGGYSYSIANGPPNAQLLDVRPDDVIRQYIIDYIAIAGTYPCVQDLSQYQEGDGDPVLKKQTCAVHRTVSKIQLTMVDVQLHCRFLLNDCFIVVLVHISISYSTGQIWNYNKELVPSHRVAYYRTFIHLSCWDLGIDFYARIDPNVPKGVLYTDNSYQQHCS